MQANFPGMSTMTSFPDDPAIAGFWRVVAERGWHDVSMRAVAAEAGLEAAELRRRFAAPQSILEAHGRAVDAEVVAGTVDDPTSTPRDRLFDVLMRRIDALTPHRAGVVRLWDDLPRTPLLGLTLAGQLPVSMAWMLEAAGLSASGVKGALRVQGLGLVWLATLRAWAEDDSADLSTTMAALDRALDQADRAARWLSLGETEAPSAEAGTAPDLAGMDAVSGADGPGASPSWEGDEARPDQSSTQSGIAAVPPTGALPPAPAPELGTDAPSPGEGETPDRPPADAADAAELPEDWGRTPKAGPPGDPVV
jgi:AcrR family transcriptional regulator